MVFIKSCGTDTVELTSCKHRLKKVSGVHGTIGFSGAYYGVKLIDEHKYLSVGLLNFIENCLESLLKLTSVLCTCHKGTHVKGEYLLILKAFRNFACSYSLGKTFNNCGFTYTGFTDEYRVILGLSAQDPDNVSDLLISSDYGVQLLILCALYHFIAILIQGIIGALRVICGHPLISSYFRKCLQELILCDVIFLKELLNSGICFFHYGQEDVLYRNIIVPH